MESAIYMCGMTALDHDDPCYVMFQCDPSLECDSHAESEFFRFKKSAKADGFVLSLR